MVGAIHHLRAAGVSVVPDARGPRLPRITHWGADLGDLDPTLLVDADVPAVVSDAPDEPVTPSVLAEHATGWPGVPGRVGHRAGRDWSTLFDVTDSTASNDGGTERLVTRGIDDSAGLAITVTIELTGQGVLRANAGLIDLVGPDRSAEPYFVDGLTPAFPVRRRATELLDFTGRHLRERHPQRRPFDIGTRVRDNRRGRTGADATLLLAAGTPGFGFPAGEGWALHTAWSGNHRSIAERTPNGHAVLAGGELLLPGGSPCPPAVATELRGSTAPTASARMRWQPGSTPCCATGRITRAPLGRSS